MSQESFALHRGVNRLSTGSGRLSPRGVDGGLPIGRVGRDNYHKDTTNASRPRTNGALTPVQGLARRKDTTDS